MRVINKILKDWKYWLILVSLTIIFIVTTIKFIPIVTEYNTVNKIYKNIEKQVLSQNDSAGDNKFDIPFTYDHKSLLAINQDGLGYIYIPSINLKLPLAQTSDNNYYLSHTFDKTSNINGCLFEDYRISKGLSAYNVVIHGHNMKSGAMFGKLPRYRDYDFWSSFGNDIFYIFTNNVIRKYQIFSIYITEPISDTYTYNFASVEALRNYAINMKEKSIYDTNIDVSNTSQVITLSTCTQGGKKRFIVHATYIEEVTIS